MLAVEPLNYELNKINHANNELLSNHECMLECARGSLIVAVLVEFYTIIFLRDQDPSRDGRHLAGVITDS